MRFVQIFSISAKSGYSAKRVKGNRRPTSLLADVHAQHTARGIPGLLVLQFLVSKEERFPYFDDAYICESENGQKTHIKH